MKKSRRRKKNRCYDLVAPVGLRTKLRVAARWARGVEGKKEEEDY